MLPRFDCFLLVGLLMIAVPAVPPAHAQSPGQQTLQVGDVVRIAVWRSEELSGEFIIGSDSAMLHPLYQQVKVVGVPLEEVRDRLRRFLTTFSENPQFAVQPLFRVAVSGQVRAPNLFSLPRETTVAQAIAQAGGPTDEARLNAVQVIRGRQQINVDLFRAGPTGAEMPIQSGDQIIVGRRRSVLRDVVGPLASVAGAAAAIVAVFRL